MGVEAVDSAMPVKGSAAAPYAVAASAAPESPVRGSDARDGLVAALGGRVDRVTALQVGEQIGMLPVNASVIVILMDDLNPNWLDFMGQGEKYGNGTLSFSDEDFRYARTPFMTDIATSSGVWFSNAYATPICSSSRARLQFGKRTDELGVGTNVRGPGLATSATTYPSTGIAVSASNVALAEYLRSVDTGIETAHFGKWHLCDPWSTVGNGLAAHPPDVNLTDPAVMGYQTSVWSPLPYGGGYAWWKIDNGTPTYVDGVTSATYDEDTYPSTAMAKEAITWLQARTGRFFLSLSIDPPHMPLTSPPWTWTYGNLLSAETQAELTTLGYLPGDNLIGNPQNQTARNNPEFYVAYRANIEVADSIASAVWANVPASLRANTYLIILSDNGGAASTIPGGFPEAGKGSLNKGGTQVHMVVRGPGVAHPGREVKQLVSIADVSRTVAEIAGYPTFTNFRAGVSFVSCLYDAVDRNDVDAHGRQNIVEQIFFPLGVTVPANFDPASRYRSIYDGRYRLILPPTGEDPSFYDQQRDPVEATDLYGNLSTEQQIAYDSLHTALLAELPI